LLLSRAQSEIFAWLVERRDASKGRWDSEVTPEGVLLEDLPEGPTMAYAVAWQPPTVELERDEKRFFHVSSVSSRHTDVRSSAGCTNDKDILLQVHNHARQ
jgi:hypothetical protein